MIRLFYSKFTVIVIFKLLLSVKLCYKLITLIRTTVLVRFSQKFIIVDLPAIFFSVEALNLDCITLKDGTENQVCCHQTLVTNITKGKHQNTKVILSFFVYILLQQPLLDFYHYSYNSPFLV